MVSKFYPFLISAISWNRFLCLINIIKAFAIYIMVVENMVLTNCSWWICYIFRTEKLWANAIAIDAFRVLGVIRLVHFRKSTKAFDSDDSNNPFEGTLIHLPALFCLEMSMNEICVHCTKIRNIYYVWKCKCISVAYKTSPWVSSVVVLLM